LKNKTRKKRKHGLADSKKRNVGGGRSHKEGERFRRKNYSTKSKLGVGGVKGP